MVANGDNGKGSIAIQSFIIGFANVSLGGSLVDASGYKFADKDTKPGKIKLKKPVNKNKAKKADGVFFCTGAAACRG